MRKLLGSLTCLILMLAGYLSAGGEDLAQLKEDLAFEMTFLLDLQQRQKDLEVYDKYSKKIKSIRENLKKAETNYDKYFFLNKGRNWGRENELKMEKIYMSHGKKPWSYIIPSIYDSGAFGKNSPNNKSVTHWRKQYWKHLDVLSTEMESVNKRLSVDYDIGEMRDSTFKSFHELEAAVDDHTDKDSRKQLRIDITNCENRIADLKRRIEAYAQEKALDISDLIGVWKIGNESSIEIKKASNGLSGVLASGSLSRFDTLKEMWSNFRPDPRVNNRYMVNETDRKGNVSVITLDLIDRDTLNYEGRSTLRRIR
jgi:hypothetical protein